jgi:kynurenine formamidase
MGPVQTAPARAPGGVIEAARRKKIIDQTQTWHSRVPTWPSFPSSVVRNVHSHHTDGVHSLIIETDMHSGTHIDAPLRFNAGGWDVDNIGGDIAKVAGRRIELQAFPWRFQGGEACITRLLAYVDEA